MRAKEYLLRYKSAKEEVRRRKEEIELLEAEIEHLSGEMDGMPRSGALQDMTGRRGAALADARTDLDKAASDEMQALMDVFELIAGVSDVTLRKLLFFRYVRFMSWVDIGARLAYSEYHVRRVLHGRALLQAEQILQKKDTRPYTP